MCLREILFLFCLICLSGLVTSENEMDFKLPEYLKFEINKYVSDIVGKLTEKYENRIGLLEQRIAVLESNELQFLQEHKDGSAENAHNHDGQDDANIDQAGAIVSQSQPDGAVNVGHADDMVKSTNFTGGNKNIQRTFAERKSSFNKSNVPRIVQSALLSRDRRQVDTKVAFFATLTNTITNMGANQDIPFNNVVTNLGNGYNGNHGTFIAPVSGIYVFTATLHQNGEVTWGHFVVNGNVIAKIDVLSQSSQTVIIHLQQGDDVSVQNTAPGRNILGDRYSAFSGFLLYQ